MNKMRKSVSAIIPVFNAEKWITQAIKSCIDQGEYLKEIIAVDDFSTDRSWDVLQEMKIKYRRLVRVFRNKEKGGNHARNFGFSLSSGEYIQWLDADDTILRGKLKAQIDFLERNPDIDIAYSGWQQVEFIENKIITARLNPTMQHPDFLYTLLNKKWLPPHAFLVRRTCATRTDKRKGWDPQTYVCQDWEYFAKAALGGAKFGYVPGIFCIYNNRLNENSVSKSVTNEIRAKEIIRLLTSTYEEIQQQEWIDEGTRKLYNKLVLTQIFQNSLFYNLPFEMKNACVPKIDWNTINGLNAKLHKLESLLEIL